MIDAETRERLEGGCSLVVGTVDRHGQPHASRAWGLDVVDAAGSRVRIVLPGDDPTLVENLDETGRLALTGSDVPTLVTIQAKGTALSVTPATAADRRRAERYCHAFFGDIERTDGTPRALLERLVPRSFKACEAVLEEWYDQTPGPRAGSERTEIR